MWETPAEDILDEGGVPGYYWMEGDSLAPPCAADSGVVEAIVRLAGPYLIKEEKEKEEEKAKEEKLLIDLGCGDVSIYSLK